MFNVEFKTHRSSDVIAQTKKDKLEGTKNPTIPGARIFRHENARPAYVNSTGCYQWFYHLSEVNDLGMFSYIIKDGKSDRERPWQFMSHPEVNMYYYILSGTGNVEFGGGNTGYLKETYKYGPLDLVVIPRGIPYRMFGEWKAVCFHVRTGIYGTVSGNSRFTHPTLYYDRPSRPTIAEYEALGKPGELYYSDSLYTKFIKSHMPIDCFEFEHFNPASGLPNLSDETYKQIMFEATPLDEQIKNSDNLRESQKNPSVFGARVINNTDSPAVYNSNAALKQTSYPLTWTDDIAICNLAEKLASSDKERPFDSHAHGDIEEYKFIINGSGTTTIGVGDETCAEEKYDFFAGDLVALPRGLPHVEAGGWTAIFFHAKQSAFGITAGNVLYPHIAYVYTKPPRPTPEEEAVLNDPGTYVMMNSRETYNIYKPNPILRVEKNRTEMTYLRPDLFDK